MSDQELILIRNSERSVFMRCRQRWDWSYNQGLHPKVAAPALRFGSLVHEALAAYYKPGRKRGPKPWITFKKEYLKELDNLSSFGIRTESDDWENALDLGIAMLKHYFKVYGMDDDVEVIAPEQEFQIDVMDPETGEYLCTAVGTFDAIIRRISTKKIGLFEHKTAKIISTAHLSLDEQAGMYWAFAPDWLRSQGILKKNEDLDFILYNFLRKAAPDDRPTNEDGYFLNQDGSVSKRQPSPYFQRQVVFRGEYDRGMVMRRMVAQAREMDLVREGTLEVYKNPTRDCSWDCEFGPKSGMCEMHEIGDDWEEIRDQSFVFWNPYEAHEVVYEREE